MKALIVDDEPLARRELRRLLAEFPWIDICGEAGNIAEAARRIEALGPDLLFLDIKMPGGSGFDLLTRLDALPRARRSDFAAFVGGYLIVAERPPAS